MKRTNFHHLCMTNSFFARVDQSGQAARSICMETALIIGETLLTVEDSQIEGEIILMFLVSDLKELLKPWQDPSSKKYA